MFSYFLIKYIYYYNKVDGLLIVILYFKVVLYYLRIVYFFLEMML